MEQLREYKYICLQNYLRGESTLSVEDIQASIPFVSSPNRSLSSMSDKTSFDAFFMGGFVFPTFACEVILIRNLHRPSQRFTCRVLRMLLTVVFSPIAVARYPRTQVRIQVGTEVPNCPR